MRIGTIVFADVNLLLKEIGIDLIAYLIFDEGKNYAGTLPVECRYNHEMEARCDGRGPLEVATSGTDDVLGLASGNASPALFEGTAPTTACRLRARAEQRRPVMVVAFADLVVPAVVAGAPAVQREEQLQLGSATGAHG